MINDLGSKKRPTTSIKKQAIQSFKTGKKSEQIQNRCADGEKKHTQNMSIIICRKEKANESHDDIYYISTRMTEIKNANTKNWQGQGQLDSLYTPLQI